LPALPRASTPQGHWSATTQHLLVVQAVNLCSLEHRAKIESINYYYAVNKDTLITRKEVNKMLRLYTLQKYACILVI
jgi:hypothetical protein